VLLWILPTVHSSRIVGQPEVTATTASRPVFISVTADEIVHSTAESSMVQPYIRRNQCAITLGANRIHPDPKARLPEQLGSSGAISAQPMISIWPGGEYDVSLRPSTAATFIRRGGSVFHSQKVLGHSSLE
jgi:hypothetical protein